MKTVGAGGEMALDVQAARASRPTEGRMTLRRIWRFKWGVAAAVILLGIIGSAVGAPWLAPDNPLAVDIEHRLSPPSGWTAARTAHVLGTDQVGRDLFSRMIYGGRARW